MILCPLADAMTQVPDLPQLRKAIAWLQNSIETGALEELMSNLQSGDSRRVSIDGDKVYAQASSYNTSPLSGARLEAHRRYIDVQYVYTGAEQVMVDGLEAAKANNSKAIYDEAKDIVFYPMTDTAQPLRLTADWILVLFPEDAHAPGLSIETSVPIKKVVIKAKREG